MSDERERPARPARVMSRHTQVILVVAGALLVVGSIGDYAPPPVNAVAGVILLIGGATVLLGGALLLVDVARTKEDIAERIANPSARADLVGSLAFVLLGLLSVADVVQTLAAHEAVTFLGWLRGSAGLPMMVIGGAFAVRAVRRLRTDSPRGHSGPE